MSPNTELPDFISLWNYGNPTATEEKFRELLPIAEQSGDSGYHAELLTQIARTHSLRAQFDTAHEILDRVEAMLQPDIPRARVRYLLERGRCYNSAGTPQQSIPLFMEAWQLGESINAMRLAIDAVHMLAIAEQERHKKIEWNLKGLAMVEAHPEQKGWLWALYNNIGEDYLAISDYEKAWQSFHALTEFQRERTGNADMYTLKDEAKALRLWGKTNEALALLQPLLEQLQAEQKDDGWIREEVAESLHAQGSTEAKAHFVKAYQLLSQDDYCQRYEQEKLAHLKQMAE